MSHFTVAVLASPIETIVSTISMVLPTLVAPATA